MNLRPFKKLNSNGQFLIENLLIMVAVTFLTIKLLQAVRTSNTLDQILNEPFRRMERMARYGHWEGGPETHPNQQHFQLTIKPSR